VRRLAPLLVLALAGCGSAPAAELPAPAGPPRSPALTEQPAGEIAPIVSEPIPTVESGFELDRANDRLSSAAGRSTATCREPIASAALDRGARVAVLCGRERVLDIHDAKTLERLGRTGAGIGPTAVATNGVELLHVTDLLGDALLVYSLRPFQLIRRVHLGGGPYAIAYDRERRGLWIALAGSNRLVNYSAGTRPVIREDLPSIRDAREVIVTDDTVTVRSERERQTLRLRSR
jgi:hypothetical protein